MFSRMEGEHSHELSTRKTARHLINVAVKKKAVRETSLRPNKLIDNELRAQPNQLSVLTARDIAYVRHNAYNARRALGPKLPTSLEESINQLSAYQAKTSKDENFILHVAIERKSVVFSCPTNMEVLRQSEVIYVDSTFEYCPKHFKQMFTLHVLLQEQYIPVVFALLPDKAEASYKAVFQLLASDYNIQPHTVVADFEAAIHNAVIAVWPHAVITGCRFHLLQARFRNVQQFGLSKDYIDETEVGKWIRYTFGLPFLAPTEVMNCYLEDLFPILIASTHLDEHKSLEKYRNYLLNNYLADDSRFPSHLWADQTAAMGKTTNACESFHADFNASFYSSHPDLYTFIDTLLMFQNKTYIKINSLGTGDVFPPIRREVRERHAYLQKKLMSTIVELFHDSSTFELWATTTRTLWQRKKAPFKIMSERRALKQAM